MKPTVAVARIVAYGLVMFLALLLFTFLHECGHGFGAVLDGTHISTGFNRVGDPGKRPSDIDFRSNQVITGVLSSSDILGPGTNWFFALLFTAFCAASKAKAQTAALWANLAIVNAWSRLWQMTLFFLAAVFGRVHLEDETLWALHSVKSLLLPTSFEGVTSQIQRNSQMILRQPQVYFWPTISLMISVVCSVLAYRKLYSYLNERNRNLAERILIGSMPLIATPLAFLLLGRLDNMVRINW